MNDENELPQWASVSSDDTRELIILTLRHRPESLKTINFPMTTTYAEHLIKELQAHVDAQKKRT